MASVFGATAARKLNYRGLSSVGRRVVHNQGLSSSLQQQSRHRCFSSLVGGSFPLFNNHYSNDVNGDNFCGNDGNDNINVSSTDNNYNESATTSDGVSESIQIRFAFELLHMPEEDIDDGG